MIILKNPRLTAEIDPVGAQLCSVRSAAGTEYIWQADPAIWGRHAPLLFPVIGRLKDGRYVLNGREYAISQHGFARDGLFEVLEERPERAVLRLTDSPETRAVYPFAFSLAVTYVLEENRLRKSCRVENRSPEVMYCEIGGHDGFRAPLDAGEVMDGYAVVIPGVGELEPYGMDAELMVTPKGARFPLDRGRIPLKPSVFGLDTVILDSPAARRAMLVDKSGRARVTVEFPDFPYIALWTQGKPFDTNYVCIEPWSTLPDAAFVGRGLADKAGILALEPGAARTLTYTTTFS